MCTYNKFWMVPFVYVFYNNFSFAKLLEFSVEKHTKCKSRLCVPIETETCTGEKLELWHSNCMSILVGKLIMQA